MKTKLTTLLLVLLTMNACQQYDFISENNDESKVPENNLFEGINVEDGYLNFSTSVVFEEFLSSLEKRNETETTITRAQQNKIPGFTSISSLKKSILNVTRNVSNNNDDEDEEMSQEEFAIANAEDLLIDPILLEVMDTSLRIKIENRLFKITSYGTFSANMQNAEHRTHRDCNSKI